MAQEMMNFRAEQETVKILDELNNLAVQRHREDNVKLGPGQFPFRSQIIRKALQIAAPAIRSGLEEEGVLFLFA
jgi:hypothetical protein